MWLPQAISAKLLTYKLVDMKTYEAYSLNPDLDVATQVAGLLEQRTQGQTGETDGGD